MININRDKLRKLISEDATGGMAKSDPTQLKIKAKHQREEDF